MSRSLKEFFAFTPTSWILLIFLAIGATYFYPHFFGSHPSYGAMTHDLGAGHTLTVDGSKRSIITRDEFTCAEPAPDAMAAFATNLAASLSSQNSGLESDAMISAISDPKTQLLFRRTQGIQAIRDGMFRLCEARMNTAVQEAFYEEQMTDLLSTLNFIVPLELCINASTKMGELFGELEQNAGSADDLSSPELISSYMQMCLNISKDYGLTLAQNAAERRHARRAFEQELNLLEIDATKQLELERVRVSAFLSQREPAPQNDMVAPLE